MKKLYFKKLLSLFLAGTMVAAVGCKDYDDDINKLNNRIDELTTGSIASLESQMTAMKTTVANLEAADQALGTRIDELKKEVDELNKQVDKNTSDIAALNKLEAKITALETKIADLQTTQNQIKSDVATIKANYVDKSLLANTLASYATLDYVSKTYAKLSDLGKFGTEKAIQDAIDAAKNAAVAAAGAACEAAFQGKFDAAVAAAQLVDATKLQDAIDAYDTKIKNHITQAIEANNGVINEKIAADIATAKGELTTELKKWVSGRLTSLTLIPETYEDGIETIDVQTINYKQLKKNGNKEQYIVDAAKQPWFISETATPVRYHVSPSVVTNADVAEPSMLLETVKTRAAVNNTLLAIVANDFTTGAGNAWNIANSEMKINVRRITSHTALPLSGNTYNAVTTALKVPIADKLLQDGEAGTSIYSDYAQVAELFYNVKIAALRDDANASKTKTNKFEDKTGTHFHFYKEYQEGTVETDKAAVGTTKPNASCDYDKTIDLLTLVTGCATDADTDTNVREITKKKLAEAGLQFRFAVPTLPFELGANNADQQKYIKLDGSIAMPVTPEGTVKNRASIDKTPVVRIELIDTKNGDNLVDVRYIKLVWTEASYAIPHSFGTDPLGCKFEYTFTWKQMNALVLEKIGEQGISQYDFVNLYDAPVISTTDTYSDRGDVVANNEVVSNFDEDAPESAAAFTWKLKPQNVGTLINTDGTVKDEFKNGKKMTVTLTMKRKNASDKNGQIDLTFDVTIVVPELPCKVNAHEGYWWSDYSAYTAKHLGTAFSVIMPQSILPLNPDWTNGTVNNTVSYDYQLSKTFNGNMPLTGLNTCAVWDIQFTKTQPVNGYSIAVQTEPDYVLGNGAAATAGYMLKEGATKAAELVYNSAMGNNWYGATQQLQCSVKIENNASGKKLIGKFVTAKIWGSLNTYNIYSVETVDMFIKEPLFASNELELQTIPWIGTTRVIDCSKALTLKDFEGIAVALTQTGTERENYLAKYYDVKNLEWESAKAIVNYKNGKETSIDDITPDNFDTKSVGFQKLTDAFKKSDDSQCFTFSTTDGKPTFQYSQDQSTAVKTMTALVPLKIDHKWGSFRVLVKIEVKSAVND